MLKLPLIKFSRLSTFMGIKRRVDISIKMAIFSHFMVFKVQIRHESNQHCNLVSTINVVNIRNTVNTLNSSLS